MVTDALRAVVFGSGYAAEGHALALRHAGVEVVAVTSRNADICARMAASLKVPRHGVDWRTILDEVRPDIVSVATPAGARQDVVETALSQGCHLYCEKPLALGSADARELFELAKASGCKTAYAATCRYQPQIAYARELIEGGVLGRLHELEFVSHIGQPPLMPFGWIHQVESGGGRLYNQFPHLLAIAERLVNGRMFAVVGECRSDLERAPIAEAVHDLRDYAKNAVAPETASQGQWAEVTSDLSYTAIGRLQGNDKYTDKPVSALFRHGVVLADKNTDYVAAFGEKGTIHIDHVYAEGDMFLCRTGGAWEMLTIPERLMDEVPGPGLWPQRLWNRLALDLVRDIRGEGGSDYLTFRDGWFYQQIIDIVRDGKGWTTVPGAVI